MTKRLYVASMAISLFLSTVQLAAHDATPVITGGAGTGRMYVGGPGTYLKVEVDVGKASLMADVLDSLNELEQPVNSGQELLQRLLESYFKVMEVDISRYDLNEVRAVAPVIVQMMFNAQKEMWRRIPDWEARGFMTADVQQALHNLIRVARYTADMVGEAHIGFAQLGKNEHPMRAFSGGLPYTVTDSTKGIQFQSGDILLVRGLRHNSAAIARIGDANSQFSHIAVIGEDENQQLKVIEALIETGVTIHDLDYVLEHGVGRMVLLRYTGDKEAAARAGRIAYETASKAIRSGQPIPYDFSMELDNYEKMFCSKLARYAYDVATDGQLKIPYYPSTMNMKNRDFFERIGTKVNQTFAPGDIQIDPRFEIIAEWRDFRMTSSMRLKDFVIDKIFEWMERENLKFTEDPISFLGSAAVKSLSKIPGVNTLLASATGPIPDYMTREIIATMIMLHATAEPLYLKLVEAERKRLEQPGGYPLHPKEAYDILEEIKAESGSSIYYLGKPKPKCTKVRRGKSGDSEISMCR